MFCREHAAQLVPVRAELYREEAVTLSPQQVAQVRLSQHTSLFLVPSLLSLALKKGFRGLSIRTLKLVWGRPPGREIPSKMWETSPFPADPPPSRGAGGLSPTGRPAALSAGRVERWRLFCRRGHRRLQKQQK